MENDGFFIFIEIGVLSRFLQQCIEIDVLSRFLQQCIEIDVLSRFLQQCIEIDVLYSFLVHFCFLPLLFRQNIFQFHFQFRKNHIHLMNVVIT